MTRYLALLRGINVGGNKRVPMAELRALAERIGLTEVSTYINSGNLIFSADTARASLEAALEVGIEERFGFAVSVMVRSHDELQAALRGNPYPGANPAQVILAFTRAAPPAEAAEQMAMVVTADERFEIHGDCVYVDYGGGLARSKLAAGFDKLLGVAATGRNLRTIEKLVQLSQ